MILKAVRFFARVKVLLQPCESVLYPPPSHSQARLCHDALNHTSHRE